VKKGQAKYPWLSNFHSSSRAPDGRTNLLDLAVGPKATSFIDRHKPEINTEDTSWIREQQTRDLQQLGSLAYRVGTHTTNGTLARMQMRTDCHETPANALPAKSIC